MNTDTIADMLTRIRNGAAIAAAHVDVPSSKFKRALAELLVSEGYLKSVEDATNDLGHPLLRIGLKYGPRRTSVINKLTRVSKPGRRAYAKATAVPVVRGGLGIAVISTQQGLMVDRDARRKHVGGEVICEVW
ncbi:MAG: 30S ribosomal protein S8 [Trueperaceae bacterium]|nr:30S ribosomal protein S8 [Trueperaceae bacterium]